MPIRAERNNTAVLMRSSPGSMTACRCFGEVYHLPGTSGSDKAGSLILAMFVLQNVSSMTRAARHQHGLSPGCCLDGTSESMSGLVDSTVLAVLKEVNPFAWTARDRFPRRTHHFEAGDTFIVPTDIPHRVVGTPDFTAIHVMPDELRFEFDLAGLQAPY